MKIGDKVKIFSKSAGDTNNWFGWKVGDIGIIRSIIDDKYYINTLENKERRGAFRDYDLRLIEEFKYKFIKKFMPFNLISNSPASIGEKDKFNKKMVEMGYGLYDIIDMNLEFYNYFTQHDCFIKYLLENHFIEEKNTFKSFKITFDVTNKEEFKVLYDAIGDCSCFNSEWDILNKKEKEIS